MWHPIPGFSGLVGGGLVFVVVGAVSFLTKEDVPYNIDPQGKPGAFEPILAKYIKAAELIIGLATGSIVLLVGSSALHSQGGRLPWFYASPLILLSWSVIGGVVFIVWVVHRYESYQHGQKHTRVRYTISETLGFGSLFCFGLGYFVLILVVTH